MKTATIRELRKHLSAVLKWVSAGEEVTISRRGVIVARLVPATPPTADPVNWKESAAFQMDKSKLKFLSAKESAALLAAASGNW